MKLEQLERIWTKLKEIEDLIREDTSAVSYVTHDLLTLEATVKKEIEIIVTHNYWESKK